MCEIRIAKIDDRESIFNLITELEESQINRSEFNSIFWDNIYCPNVYYYVAVDKEAIIGFISVHIQKLLHHTSSIAEIQELIVTKRFQGLGIGKLLFEKAKETAIYRKCLQLEVCCNQKRVASHTFYKCQGMTNNHFKFCLSLYNKES